MSRLDQYQSLQLLNDHYKDTFTRLAEYRQLRDRLFALILVMITIVLFGVYSPNEADIATGEIISKQLGLQSPLDISFIGSIIWFSLLSLVIRYFQTVMLIERQYDYVHKLEDELSRNFKGVAFTREGKSYLENYPLFSNWTHFLYASAFPGILIIVTILKIGNEIYYSNGLSLLLAFNIVFAVCILISTVLYLMSAHRRAHNKTG